MSLKKMAYAAALVAIIASGVVPIFWETSQNSLQNSLWIVGMALFIMATLIEDDKDDKSDDREITCTGHCKGCRCHDEDSDK